MEVDFFLTKELHLKINSNWVEASSSENFYDTNGRLFRTETTKDNKTIREDYGFDTFGRITSVKTTDPANSSRYRVKFYNTGGQVVWEADEESNAIQKILMSNILTKMLKLGESEQPPVFIDNSTGPNGAIMIYKNPYYKSKDPLKMIFFYGDNGSGRPMIYRNPFVPGASYGYDSTTYEKWQQKGFIQPEVDPWLK